jgi:leucyl-tRNA synthetase
MARVQAPVEKELQWDEDGIRGQSRFLQRLWGLAAHASGTARRGHSASRSKIVEVRLASWHDTFRNVAQPWWQPQRSFAFLPLWRRGR